MSRRPAPNTFRPARQVKVTTGPLGNALIVVKIIGGLHPIAIIAFGAFFAILISRFWKLLLALLALYVLYRACKVAWRAGNRVGAYRRRRIRAVGGIPRTPGLWAKRLQLAVDKLLCVHGEDLPF
jgi:hypothetical protein